MGFTSKSERKTFSFIYCLSVHELLLHYRLLLQYKVKRYKKDQTSRLGEEICRERVSLQKAIEGFEEQRQVLLPLSCTGAAKASKDNDVGTAAAKAKASKDDDDDDDGIRPELSNLCLPSDFSPTERHIRGLTAAGVLECRLREGQAFDVLDKLRYLLQYRYAMTGKRQTNNGSQRINTRFRTLLNDTTENIKDVVNIYNETYKAILTLKPEPGSRASKLLPIEAKDLSMKKIHRYHEIGDGRKNNSWIWSAAGITLTGKEEQDEWIENSKYICDFYASGTLIVCRQGDLFNGSDPKPALTDGGKKSSWFKRSFDAPNRRLGLSRNTGNRWPRKARNRATLPMLIRNPQCTLEWQTKRRKHSKKRWRCGLVWRKKR